MSSNLLNIKNTVNYLNRQKSKLNLKTLEYIIIKGRTCYDSKRKLIYLSEEDIKNKYWAFFYYLHELGHHFTYDKKKNTCVSELNANTWLNKCLLKYFSNDKIYFKLFYKYLIEMLHSSSLDYSNAAYTLLKKLNYEIIKVGLNKFKVMPKDEYLKYK